MTLSSSVDVKEASNVARGAVLGLVGVLGVTSFTNDACDKSLACCLSLLVDDREDDLENLDNFMLNLDLERTFVASEEEEVLEVLF